MRKPCTNVAPKLTLYPNRLKQDSTWHTWSRSSIRCVQIDFREYGTFHANIHLSCIKIYTISKQTKSSFHLSLFTLEYHWELPQWFLTLWCTGHKPCTYLAPKLILSPTGLKWDTIWYNSSGASTVPSGLSKLISEHMVCSMQTVRLSCINIRTISKQTEQRFHLNLFTKEYHHVHPK